MIICLISHVNNVKWTKMKSCFILIEIVRFIEWFRLMRNVISFSHSSLNLPQNKVKIELGFNLK